MLSLVGGTRLTKIINESGSKASLKGKDIIYKPDLLGKKGLWVSVMGFSASPVTSSKG